MTLLSEEYGLSKPLAAGFPDEPAAPCRYAVPTRSTQRHPQAHDAGSGPRPAFEAAGRRGLCRK
jgi:hypothetical protein